MLDPYLFGLNPKSKKDSRIVNGEQNTQAEERQARPLFVRNPLTLRLGMLLIRMGRELTGGETVQEGTKGP